MLNDPSERRGRQLPAMCFARESDRGGVYPMGRSARALGSSRARNLTPNLLQKNPPVKSPPNLSGLLGVGGGGCRPCNSLLLLMARVEVPPFPTFSCCFARGIYLTYRILGTTLRRALDTPNATYAAWNNANC